MSQDDQVCKSGHRQRSLIILEFHPQPEALRGFALHHPIQSIRRCQPTLDRRRQNEARDILILTFLVIEARRYEHAGGANRIHCR